MPSSGFVALVQSPHDSNPKSSVPYLGTELKDRIHQSSNPIRPSTVYGIILDPFVRKSQNDLAELELIG